MAIMYYKVTFWKDIKENADSKKDTQVIMGFANKEGFGVTSLQLQAGEVQAPQYVEEQQLPEEAPQQPIEE